MSTNPTNSTKILTGIVIVIVILALGRWWYVSRQSSPTAMDMASSTDMNGMGDMSGMNMGASSSTGQMSQTTSSAAGTAAVSASATGNSDAALNQDVNNIDTQMNGLNSDNASADQGLSNPNQ